MARIRSIKPEFWESETIGRRSLLARLTFIGLWNLADDMGRGRGESGAIWGRLHSYQGSATKARWKRALSELQKPDRDGIPFVIFYKIGTVSYFWLPTFCVHQKIDHPSPSKLPACPQEPELLARVRERFALDQGAGSREQGEERGGEGPPPSSAAPGDPGFQFRAGLDAEIAQAYREYDDSIPEAACLKHIRRASREGVDLEKVLPEVSKRAPAEKLWAILDSFKAKKPNGNGRHAPPPVPENPEYLKRSSTEDQAKLNAAWKSCDEKLAAMSVEEIASWTREAEEQAAREKVLGLGLKMYITGVLRKRAAEKFGIEGV